MSSKRFSNADVIRIVDESGAAEAHISLHGGQVLSFTVRGREALYLSPGTAIGGPLGKATRGGAPVCFPQFSNFGPFAASHGFGRLLSWSPAAKNTSSSSSSATVTLTASSAREQLAVLAGQGFKPEMSIPPEMEFSASITATIVRDSLDIVLTVCNESTETPMPFTAALHTYFAVSSLDGGGVTLDGDYRKATSFLNTAAGRREEPNDGLSEIRGGAEVDRIYLGLGERPTVTITDKGSGSVTVIESHGGMCDQVLWNPGSKKNFADMPAGHHDKFVCVEACIIDPKKVLAPGESFSAGQKISLRGANSNL